jgi:hypothetical protein
MSFVIVVVTHLSPVLPLTSPESLVPDGVFLDFLLQGLAMFDPVVQVSFPRDLVFVYSLKPTVLLILLADSVLL